MKEIPIKHLLKTITPRRVLNATAASASFLMSNLTRRTIVWGRPFILTVEPTNYCNLKCPLCITGNETMTRNSGVMTLRTFQKIIDEIGDYLFYLLLYQQGEPYINKDFLEFVRYASSKRIFVTTSSNGHYLDREQAAQTIASGMDSIIVSIDGTDQDTYSKYRVNGDLGRVLAGVRNLVAEKRRQRRATPVIYLQFIVMKQNEHQTGEMRELARNLGADHVLFKSVFVDSTAEAQTWLPAHASFRRYAGSEGDKLVVKRATKGTCHRPWTSSLVNWDGSTVPCCFDKDADHNFGNSDTEKSFHAIWRNRHYTQFRSKMLTDREGIDICSNCTQGIRLFR